MEANAASTAFSKLIADAACQEYAQAYDLPLSSIASVFCPASANSGTPIKVGWSGGPLLIGLSFLSPISAGMANKYATFCLLKTCWICWTCKSKSCTNSEASL